MARDGSKSGGRPKGARNKDTLEADALAKKLGIDPFEVLLRMAAGQWEELGYKAEKRIVGMNEYGEWDDYTIPVAVRAKAAERATEFLRPKLKSVDITADGLKDAMALSFTALLAQATKDASEPDDTATG